MSRLYYEAPTQEQFEEVKRCAIAIWKTYDDTYGYASEKIRTVEDVDNVSDNFMYIVAMFDDINQRNLASMLSPETKKAVAVRLKDGGMDDYYNHFL